MWFDMTNGLNEGSWIIIHQVDDFDGTIIPPGNCVKVMIGQEYTLHEN